MLAIASHWTLIVVIIVAVLAVYGYRKMDSR
jgi:heme/copper-type cytochrome/quinol oxidase subunit 2